MLRVMREWFDRVPGLFYVAAGFVLLSLWADDIRGIYIAAFCALLGVVQMFRPAPPAREPVDDDDVLDW